MQKYVTCTKKNFFENHESAFYPRIGTQVKNLKNFRHFEEIVSKYRKLKTNLSVNHLIFCYILNIFSIKKGLR